MYFGRFIQSAADALRRAAYIISASRRCFLTILWWAWTSGDVTAATICYDVISGNRTMATTVQDGDSLAFRHIPGVVLSCSEFGQLLGDLLDAFVRRRVVLSAVGAMEKHFR